MEFRRRAFLRLAAALVILFLLFGLRYVVPGKVGDVDFATGDHKTLVVFGPALGGRAFTPDLEKLVRASHPGADVLIPTYENGFFSNSDPFDMTDRIERAIRDYDDKHHYEKIVLFGYSLGGLLLRKAYVWGHGLEDDRSVKHGPHPWVDRVDRFVSLAAPNRGFPSDKPRNLSAGLYVLDQVVQQFWRLTGTGQLVRNALQGSPFVANMRVQWINLFRLPKSSDLHRPLIVHLIGDKDELVNREDSLDIEAGTASDVIIKTLEGDAHKEIGTQIYEAGSERLTPTGEAIELALTRSRNEFPSYWPDKVSALQTDPNVKQLIFVMHGIRDESTWPAEIKRAIEKRLGDRAATVKIVPPLYRRFTLLPFLLYWDRQENVRWFMDQYTQAKALYPNLEAVDFIGHSNGTYILASAIQQYPVLTVRHIFFAGSVVPVHYDWETPIAERRVTGKIWNVCANSDWVVAIFPQLFQQVSDWLKISRPEVGLLDIGSAGFRGFRTSVKTEGMLFNMKYISGAHSAAFEPARVSRVDAIADFVTSDGETDLEILKETDSASTILEYASNLSWAIWFLGLVVIALMGVVAYRLGRWWFGVYAVLLLGLVTTV